MAQQTFIGGQIQKEKRGDLAIIVLGNGDGYNPFLYPIGSEEYIHLTGVLSARQPMIRAYVGVNHDAGGKLCGMANDLRGLEEAVLKEHLRSMDREVVLPYFLSHER
jgi:hypothetical protein